MIENFRKLDLLHMNWREIFDTIEWNFEHIYKIMLSCSVECYIEQYEGNQSVYTLEHKVVENTTLLIFVNNEYIGGKEGSDEYVLSTTGDVTRIVFKTALEDDQYITVVFLQADALANLSQKYVDKIKEMYDAMSTLNIDTIKLQDGMIGLKDYMEEMGGLIIAAAHKAQALMEYCDQLVGLGKDYDWDSVGITAEVIAARSGYSLLGERLARMVVRFWNKMEFLATKELREGDMVILYEEEIVSIYQIFNEYTGDGVVEKIINGKKALKIWTNELNGSEAHTFYLIGTEEEPVFISDSEISYGDYWIKGYIVLTHKEDPARRVLELDNFTPCTKFYVSEDVVRVIIGHKEYTTLDGVSVLEIYDRDEEISNHQDRIEQLQTDLSDLEREHDKTKGRVGQVELHNQTQDQRLLDLETKQSDTASQIRAIQLVDMNQNARIQQIEQHEATVDQAISDIRTVDLTQNRRISDAEATLRDMTHTTVSFNNESKMIVFTLGG